MRKSLRAADLSLIAGIVAATLIAILIDAASGQSLLPGPRFALGLTFAVAPALLWLALFYRQDRIEPEPKHQVATVAIVAALTAIAVVEPIIDEIPRGVGAARWIVAIFAIGLLREFTKYLAIRLIAVPNGDLDERADGVVYGTAAGLGYAAALNLELVLGAGGVAVGAGFAWMTAVTLIHGAVGGVIGHLVARDHLDGAPVWHLPLGLLLTAATVAVFHEAHSILTQGVSSPGSSMAIASMAGVALAVAVAVGVVVGLLRMMHREETT